MVVGQFVVWVKLQFVVVIIQRLVIGIVKLVRLFVGIIRQQLVWQFRFVE